MSNFKITLNEALQLKETIQDRLIRYQNIFKNENSIPAGQKRNYDIKGLVKKDEDLRQKMVALKLLIQEANLLILEGEKHCISYYVFLLSERLRQINNIKIMPTDEGSLSFKGYQAVFTCILNKVFKDEWLDQLKKEYREIQNKLIELNGKVKITLLFDPNKI